MIALPLFAEVVDVPERKYPCPNPYFLVAYWPRGGYWSIRPNITADSPNHPLLLREINELQNSGWLFITIMRLPPSGPWS